MHRSSKTDLKTKARKLNPTITNYLIADARDACWRDEVGTAVDDGWGKAVFNNVRKIVTVTIYMRSVGASYTTKLYMAHTWVGRGG